MRPVERTWFRLICGRVFYTMKRQADWGFSGKRFSSSCAESKNFPVALFHHQTPLYRDLPRVDMWMQTNKVENLRIAVARLNGTVIRPGEVLSYWRLIGRPTRRKGYRDGMVLFNGKVKSGVGGGLCQLSNLIYWMTLHTPLTVVERWRHSYDVFPDSNRTVPFGSGATCAYPFLDLQIANRTAQPVVLSLWLTDSHLAGEWRAIRPEPFRYEVYQESHLITHEPWGGYVRHNVLRRRVFDETGREIDDEAVAENHALMMYPAFLPPAVE